MRWTILLVFLCNLFASFSFGQKNLFTDECYDCTFSKLEDMLQQMDSLLLGELDISGCKTGIFVWSDFEYGVKAKSLNDSTIELRCYATLPLIDVDSFYLAAEVLRMQFILSAAGCRLEPDEKYTTPFTWTMKDIQRSISDFKKLSANPNLTDTTFESKVTAKELHDMMANIYALYYSALNGDEQSAEILEHIRTTYPYVNYGQASEEIMVIRKALGYRGRISYQYPFDLRK